MNEYEAMVRKYVEGVGGLFDLYRYEMVPPAFAPKEVEGAAWVLACLTHPQNRADLDVLVQQADLRRKQQEAVLLRAQDRKTRRLVLEELREAGLLGSECPGCGAYHESGHDDSCACDHCAALKSIAEVEDA